GCGNKPYLTFFQGLVTEYTGCDIIQSSKNVVDFLCPATELCFGDNTFDTVFSTQVMEHVADHNAMIKEAYRVLKPGGTIILTVPFCWELHEEPYDFYRFSKYGLKDLFEKHGFKVPLIKSNGGKWAAIFQLWINVLFSTRKYVTIRSRFIKLIFVRLRLIILYNRFAVWLDKKYFDDIITLNYIVIAKK
ncbi:MAG TPA: methyltransferase domain-containing protein, partial [Flavisolibacter sp.]|nr:methyltransferase domain-containing protein [Flavisolibacter sp.]